MIQEMNKTALLGLLLGVASAQTPLMTLPNGTSLGAFFNTTISMVQYDVIVKPKTWIAIGYGKTMTNTDMSYWGNNGADSLHLDLYSIGEQDP
jgi:hypothetical protein